MKRLISSLLLCVLIFSCCGSALAVDDDMLRSSYTLTAHRAYVTTGSNTGEIKINYEVGASKLSSPIGVSSIVIYKADKSYVTTIRGSTSNGLMVNSDTKKSGSYTYKGTSGVSYYAVVTMSATAGSEYDSETVTTGTARAK